ncbi:MAG: hypothetical protein EU549_00755 [Promethearchaeota archaeon]|nr:MAG: hypothetical protein EU549_00755 [Candidatus Lokiarchaeota archaeon]
MTVVRITNKKLLEEIQAKLILKIGKKLSQQEILDKSIEYLSENLDKLIEDSFPFIEISPERIQEIINTASDFEYQTSGDENLDIYGE